jgi:AcrR family transcriptional regulator
MGDGMPTAAARARSDQPTRTDRRRAQTHERITTAARELIAERGVAGLRIGAITERADVAQGSFYNYFSSKDDVVEAVVDEVVGRLAEALGGLMAALEDPAEAVSLSNRRFIGLAQDDPELARLLIGLEDADARFETMVLPQARGALERGIASGRFDISDVAATLTAAVGAALAVMRGILEGRLAAGADVAVTEGLLRSLGVEPEAARRIASRDI